MIEWIGFSTYILSTINRTILSFPFNAKFITFSLYYFFNSKLFFNFDLPFVIFFVKRSNNFFSFKITKNTCPRQIHIQVFLTFLITNSFSDQFGALPFAKLFLYFDILTPSPILNFGSLLLVSLLESVYVFDFTSTGSILIVLLYVLLYY